MLADYFLSTMKDKTVDRLKVYELLMYHDVVEIEAGDVNVFDEHKQKDKKEKEMKAAHVLRKHPPPQLGEKFLILFKEYEDSKTKEAKFARAIDALDAEIQELDYPLDWKGWKEEFLRRKKGPLMEEFPELKKAFEEIMEFAKKEGYFEQED
ncbi:MAG TPA: HD domain-containing protein [Candidatus Nanoarchaeia archaeon]|nr:HD domain-containing protein [Candidatus Nanoarchaeia archaeon]